jgi:hypothetical protein
VALPAGALAGQPQLVPGHLRLQERQAVDRDLAVLVGQQHRLVEPRGLGADVQPADRQQLGEGAQPAGRVVVARREHDRGAGPPQPGHHAAEHRRRVRRRDRAVVDVTGDEHDVHRFRGDDPGQPAQHGLLLGEQVGAVQRPADVPVGGVQQAHVRKVGRGTDRTGPGAP